jgi:hypothetical protein
LGNDLSTSFKVSAFLLVFWVVVGCRHNSQPPRPLASDGDILAKIIGKWTSSTFRGVPGPYSFSFETDGSVQLVRPGLSTNEFVWRVENGFVLISENRDALPLNSDFYWPISSIDDHNLVFATGFGVAGHEHFVK